MQIGATEIVTHGARDVFLAMRDHMPDLVPFLPNVERVEERQRNVEGAKTHVLNRWQGSTGELPAIIRPFVGREMTSWLDTATWDDTTLTCSWTIESLAGKGILLCVGTTTVTSVDEKKCRCQLVGDLRIDPTKVPGVPRILMSKVQGLLEKFIGNAISPNLSGILVAAQKYLDARH